MPDFYDGLCTPPPPPPNIWAGVFITIVKAWVEARLLELPRVHLYNDEIYDTLLLWLFSNISIEFLQY
jgi:hypothetical protein